MDRHAYMIMAHHRPDLLQLLITAIDDERNDIIIHIDKKSNMHSEQFSVKYSRLFFTDRISVNWGGYTQVECEYILMKKALSVGKHLYYHFLTGVNFPLWNQNYIHKFFEIHKGSEFIGFDNGADFSLRVKYYVPFAEHGKLIGISGKMINGIRYVFRIIQDILGIDNRKKTIYDIKKGCAYFSVTEGLLKTILQREEEMRNLLKHTICCDEVFVQTIAFNSDYKNRIYRLDNEWDGCLRELAWPSNVSGEHPGWNFGKKDVDFLLKSHNLFAMKFESPEGIEVINFIKKKRNIK
ncbi:beta-1,6-N-acetylglucosaminyltransferase [Agathobacter sp. LCP21S3_B2]|uniref:beta-1,6-N-acetylglucosaminyltransferase n=1 Tax=Agathobacter sp. LCP21S3_B2 TaxID=3438734 RepID=UPI003F8EAC5A